MSEGKKRIQRIVILLALLAVLVVGAFVSGFHIESEKIVGTFWALIPPIIAIILALVTKEVYSSLFIGVISGALLYSGFHPVKTLTTVVKDGFIVKLADSWNVGILLFLVFLGIMVAVINRAGGSAAYGKWAAGRIKTKKSALASTFGLGVLIFVDDYFNCLTVGSVMRPITDRNHISRAKLAYIIDATAAPICMIAPISSWAAAVSGLVKGYNGIELFVKTIPYNFYSLLTIVMIIYLISTNFDYGPMRKHELNADNGDLFTSGKDNIAKDEELVSSDKGKVMDLIIPIVVLVVSCVTCMIYTGGFFSGESFVNSFANCDAASALSMGALVALLITFIVYMIRRVITFNEFMECIVSGTKSMIPAILILALAWTLGEMTSLLQAKEYVAGIMENSAAGFAAFLPAIIFIVALFLAFSTGTSWGTFSILIPIVASVMSSDYQMLVISISACLAGAVCGDHCSPISDTTIMSSSGAQCNHINHVSTQLPYAITAAAVSFVSYLITGFVKTVWIALPIAIILMIVTLTVIRTITSKKTETK